MSSIATAPSPPRSSHALPQQTLLLCLIIIELVVFSAIGKNFLTWNNLLEIPRISVELGLIALAQTLVIMTGGIDLSVGSLLGLCAVTFGKLWRDAGLSPFHAASLTLMIGLIAGCLNGMLITRFRIAPLIVTLGTFSLFRGLAEGITRGVDNFTNFPASFTYLGQGYLPGHVPVQLPIFIAASIIFWLLLHRGALGRRLAAIGFSPEGARHAGISLERQLMLVYILAGLASAVAALIYVARFGQAKADAGTNFELAAIAAVVLGGTSIFGGRASIVGTLLGLFAIAILQNGLLLAALPGELKGILTGVLLLVAIGAQWRPRHHARTVTENSNGSEFKMKNTQLAVLCAVILLAALIVTGGNFLLVRSIQPAMLAPAPALKVQPNARRITVAMMPKSKGNAYFIACQKGAEEATRELGVDLIWDGPTDPDPSRQNEIVETWTTRGVDAIAVSVENRQALSVALKRARDHGIKVLTFDADANPDARDFFVNQATPEGIGNILMDNAAKTMGGNGDFAIITSSLTAANQNEWLKYIERRRSEKYPNIRMTGLRPCDDLQAKAFEQAKTLLNAQPNLKLIMAVCSPAVPGAAEAVKQSGRTDVKVVGLGLPNENKAYVHQGITTAVVLWNTVDLGYLTVYAAHAISTGALKPGDTSLEAGRLGKVKIDGDNILLGKPFTFDKDNIDQFDF